MTWFQRIKLDFIIICVSFAGCCWGLNRKIMRRSNGGVYSRPVCQHWFTLRNNKMEVKRCRERRGGTQAGASLMKEWRIDRPWQGAAGWSILMGKRSLLGDSPRSPGSLRQRGNGREMNSSSKKDTRADGWMWGWLNGRLFRRLGGLVVNACTLDLFKAGVSKATVMQMIQGAKKFVQHLCAFNSYLPDAGILTEGQN